MKNVYLAQINNTFGKNAFLPYSVGLLQAYALTNSIIKEHYNFAGFIYLREELSKVIDRLDNPDVFGISCYIWNFKISLALAETVKKAYPNCLIVLGGPHVPVRSETFFQSYSFADILVHYEGELAFTDILVERLKESPDYGSINGLSVKLSSGDTLKTPSRARTADLDSLPSPYLSGVFDEVINEPYDFHASQETHRGCPYNCCFCDWGSNTMAKLKKFSTDRILDEVHWFAKHKIDLLYNCDANYGIFERDIELTQRMANIKKEHGYPNKFRAAYAKNSNETVYKIARILNDAGMNKGITLSFQSMDDNVLTIIKRKNIKVTDFQNLMARYREDGIATYSEIIIGLPGETYDTFADGLNALIRYGQHDSIQVYTCEVLPNAEMNDPAYREKHKIKSVKTPVLFFHGTPSHDPYQEHYELVIGTATLSTADWLRCQKLSSIIQCFHCLSLTQCIAVFLYNYLNIPYREFYESLIDFAESNSDTLVGKAVSIITDLYCGLSMGREWGIIDERFGNIIWPPEEGIFLKTIVEKELFYKEISLWLDRFLTGQNIEKEVISDLVKYQSNVIINPIETEETKQVSLNYNIHECLQMMYLNKACKLMNNPKSYIISNIKKYKDFETYARELVWFGRKGGTFMHKEISCL
jgi:radical SAM superfamily enzyme YgiQ (UPF0313 family)